LHHQILPQVVVKLIVNWENTVNEWNIIFQQVVGKLQSGRFSVFWIIAIVIRQTHLTQCERILIITFASKEMYPYLNNPLM
jgi:hypothetical protein